MRRLEDVQRIVRTAARRLAHADGATFVLRDGDRCFYADEDAISPLWKGQRFPLAACISGWAMLNHSSVAIQDIYQDTRIPHEAYRPTFVKSLVMVPIRTMDPLGAIGIYWAEQHSATDQEIGAARALADSTAVALEHVQVLEQLERTVQLSQTDALTGLPNRRAWDQMLATALRPNGRPSQICVAVIDIDSFKVYNDRHGRPAGDALLTSAGAAWRTALRSNAPRGGPPYDPTTSSPDTAERNSPCCYPTATPKPACKSQSASDTPYPTTRQHQSAWPNGTTMRTPAAYSHAPTPRSTKQGAPAATASCWHPDPTQGTPITTGRDRHSRPAEARSWMPPDASPIAHGARRRSRRPKAADLFRRTSTAAGAARPLVTALTTHGQSRRRSALA